MEPNSANFSQVSAAPELKSRRNPSSVAFKVAVKESGTFANVSGKKMVGADPLEAVLLEAQIAVDSAVNNPFEFDRTGVETVAGKNFLGDRAAARNRSTLDDSDLMPRGREIRRADQAVVSCANDQRARHENSESFPALARSRASSRTFGTIDRGFNDVNAPSASSLRPSTHTSAIDSGPAPYTIC